MAPLTFPSPPITRSLAKANLTYIIERVLGAPRNGDIQQALTRGAYDTVENIVSMSNNDIENNLTVASNL